MYEGGSRTGYAYLLAEQLTEKTNCVFRVGRVRTPETQFKKRPVYIYYIHAQNKEHEEARMLFGPMRYNDVGRTLAMISDLNWRVGLKFND